MAMALVEVSYEGIPGSHFVGLAAEPLNHPGHHVVHHCLAGFVGLPPVSPSWTLPEGSPGVMCPNDTPRMKTLPHTDGQVGPRVVCERHLVAGQPRGTALSEGHCVRSPEHARCHGRTRDNFDEFTTAASISHSSPPNRVKRIITTPAKLEPCLTYVKRFSAWDPPHGLTGHNRHLKVAGSHL